MMIIMWNIIRIQTDTQINWKHYISNPNSQINKYQNYRTILKKKTDQNIQSLMMNKKHLRLHVSNCNEY